MLTLIKGTPITAIAWKKEKQFNDEVDLIFEKKFNGLNIAAKKFQVILKSLWVLNFSLKHLKSPKLERFV